MFAWLGLLPRTERLASLKKISYFLAAVAAASLPLRRNTGWEGRGRGREGGRGDVERRREDEDEDEDPPRRGAFTTFLFYATE